MAKNGNGKKGSGMLGPLYTAPNQNLGPTKPSAKVGLNPPDPLGLTHGTTGHGPSSEQRSQSHDKE